MVQSCEVELKQNCEKKKDRIESERKQAEEVRKKAMEKCGDTQKRKLQVKDGAADDECEAKSKGRRRSGNVHYLKEKAEADGREMKAKELEVMGKKA